MGGGDLSALKNRIAELYKEHSAVIVQVAKKAAGEFAPHQKAVGDLLPRLQKKQKGEAVEFSEAEKATLQAASKAGEKLLALSGIFPVAIAEQLKTMTQAVKVVMQANSAPAAKPETLTEEAALLATADISKSPDFLRDQDGRLIVLKDGKPIKEKVPTAQKYNATDRGQPIVLTVVVIVTNQPCFIFSNKNEKIKGIIILKVERPAYYIGADCVRIPETSTEEAELLNRLHLTANCHGETLANGQLFIPTSVGLTKAFGDPQEFKADPTNKNIVIFRNDKGEVVHSAKFDKKKQKYRYDDGELFPKEGTLKNAGEGTDKDGKKYPKYEKPKGVQEIEKRRTQTKGEVKNGIRIMDSENDINKG